MFILKVSIRYLLKFKFYTYINIIGLVLGITSFLFIQLYIAQESSFDKFHHDYDKVYRINSFRYRGQEGNITHEHAAAVPPLSIALQATYPNLEAVTKIYNDGEMVLSNIKESSFAPLETDKAYYANSGFFDVFSVEIIKGKTQGIFEKPHKIVLSRTIAEKLFGTIEVIGESLQTNGQSEQTYEIVAIYEDIPKNSHFKPEILLSYETYTKYVRPEFNADANWFWTNFYTYIKVKNKVSIDEINKSIAQIVNNEAKERYVQRGMGLTFKAQALSTIHLHSNLLDELEKNGDAKILEWLHIISYLILCIAWINYINIQTAISLKRVKEIGIKKILGSTKLQIVLQFLSETLIVNLLALLFSYFLYNLSSSYLEDYLGFPILTPDTFFLLKYSLFVLIVGLVAGSYPALILFKAEITSALKGFKASKSSFTGRKALILFQFCITLGLLMGTIVVYEQILKVKSTNYGIDLEHVIHLPAPLLLDENLTQSFDYFKNELEKREEIKTISNVSLIPGDEPIWYSTFYFDSLSDDTDEKKSLFVNLIEYDFKNVFNVDIIEGRSFSPAYNDSLNILINESAAASLGMHPRDVLGKTLHWQYSPEVPYFNKKIIGVVKDFSQKAYSLEGIPMVFSMRRYTPASFARGNFVIRIKNKHNISQTLSIIKTSWNEVFPNNPFNYHFLDEQFATQFENDIRFGKIFNLFMVILLITSIIGLFGLSSFTIAQRRKEISVRKILGANLSSIYTLMSISYLKLVLLATLIAAPIMYFVLNNWLNEFEIRINLSITHSMIPMLLLSLITLVSISKQTLSAAKQNITNGLKSE